MNDGATRLPDLDVLVLRPHRQDDPLVAALSARGCRVRELPVQKIVPIADTDGAITKIINRIAEYDKFIFVSRHATALALLWLDRQQQQLPATDCCYAIGPTSAALLQQRQIQVECPNGEWNSQGLLALPTLQKVIAQKILIFRGRGGLPTLAEGLARNGADVNFCELYSRIRSAEFQDAIVDLISTSKKLALLAHSGSVLDALIALLGPAQKALLQSVTLVVPGKRLGDYAALMGFGRVAVATSALAYDMEGALVDWYTSKPEKT